MATTREVTDWFVDRDEVRSWPPEFATLSNRCRGLDPRRFVVAIDHG